MGKGLSMRFILILSMVTVSLGIALQGPEVYSAPPLNEEFRLVATWAESGKNQELDSWTLSALNQLKKTESREKDPISGKLLKWKGVLLSKLIEKSLDHLTPDNRAQIDLIVLKNASGERALIPRAMITKYPMLLAIQSEGANGVSRDRGPIMAIAPWTSKPRIMDERIPVENYFLSNLERIELTSYKDRFSSLFLKRRTDPAAMRGEKIFVQTCVSCHSEGDSRVYRSSDLGSDSLTSEHSGLHASMKSALRLNDRDKKSVQSYLAAYRTEHSGPAADPSHNLTEEERKNRGVEAKSIAVPDGEPAKNI
jgi:hypothetical protein